MNAKRRLLLAAPIAGVLALGLAAVLRPRGEPEPVRASVRPKAEASSAVLPPPAAPRSLPPARAGSPAEIAQAMDEVGLKDAYDTYRTAVAQGNAPLQSALRPVLLREKAKALRLAREAVDRARSEADRSISVRTLESLER